MERKPYIFKQLKRHYNYLLNNYKNYDVIYLGLQGSQNYELDLYTDLYKSDVDTKAIIVPSLEDISLNRKPISTTIILPNNEHCDVKDIRLMMENFKKQNVNFLEILFTEFRIINPKYKDLIEGLLSLNEDIAHYNTNQALRCMAGMSMEKRKALCHPYEGLKDKIEKYGYDGKQLHHIIRMNNFIKAYTAKKSFKECLTEYTDKNILYKAKLSEYPLVAAIELADLYDEDTKTIMQNNLKEIDTINEDVLEKMNQLQYKIIKRKIELELNPEIEEDKPLFDDFSKYKNIYVTSDIHFYHSNIIKYESNRENLLTTKHSEYVIKSLKEANVEFNPTDKNYNAEEFDKQFDYYFNRYYKEMTEEMNTEIIRRWNKLVRPNDLVFILGDLAIGYKDINNLNNLISQLNGTKVLVKGNHDSVILQNGKFDKSLFKEIVDYKMIKVYGKYFIMSHYPMQVFDRQDKGAIHLYGHLHSNKLKYNIPHAYNVGMDNFNYKPVDVKDFISRDNYDDFITNHHFPGSV